jgi:dipeptidyl aminopeptidase/acylaminoacyl peptidase
MVRKHGMKLNTRLIVVLFSAIVAPGLVDAGPLTEMDVVNLEEASSPRVSPSGHDLVYSVRSTDYVADKFLSSIWLMRLDDRPNGRRLPVSDAGASSPRWSPDGKSIYFLSERSGTRQVWKTDTAGSVALQVTKLPLAVGLFKLSPDGRHLIVSMSVFPDCESPECTAHRLKERAADKATGEVFKRLYVRQDYIWDDGTRNHLFALSLDAAGEASGPPVALMAHFDGDCPRRTWASEDDIDISPDGGTVYFSAQIAGQDEPWSYNKDIWRVPIEGTAQPFNMTSGNLGPDTAPTVSPDGRYLAYLSKNGGIDAFAARVNIELMDLRSGVTRELAADWDVAPLNIGWSYDSRSLFANVFESGSNRLFRIDLPGGKPMFIAVGGGSARDYASYEGGLVFSNSSFDGPPQLYQLKHKGAPVQLTHLDAQAMAAAKLAEHEPFSFKGWNGESVFGYIFKPANYEPGHKYPTVLLIHGGPNEAWGDSWTSRWNPQTFAGAGFAVVLINPHGSVGYGHAFADAVGGHYGDRPLEDLQKGWAAALGNFSYLDGSRACALGNSYGGYMVDWIAGVWNEPWRCLVSHDGMFDMRMQYYVSDIKGHRENAVGAGGTPYEHPAAYEEFSPIDHVASWSKPILVIHSGHDYRVPLEQGLAAFGAAQRKGIPSELLYFPEELHVVTKPHDLVQWSGAIVDWLNQWTREQ